MGDQRAEVRQRRVTQRPSPQTRLRAPGSRLDFALFYSEHLGLLTRFVMRLGASPYEAAEAAQSAFVEAFPKWSQITTPPAWLRTVAARAYLRQTQIREQPTDAIPERSGGACPLAALVLKDEEQRVYAALSSLSPRQRQVMAWHLDGFSHSEISEELGMTAEAVRQNYARARVSLKRTLGLAVGEQP
ncbi:sigma-70 family RNA polymerase sigma factor [Yinghuangia sp. ASG 101]|uniref:RNA polymerase sigma factor n=1 Tax=Yinghuangia sp. ASG 101 TaxID=2896848 RepID=UPI001E2BB0FE|nr:sigma-70 family RNA polymerase sigma factor [Yinghuangia sp. ASG 101]UGQ13536.1 sigma-70 family RNA polymerase sigma factor [Yinghuangia sp. ASG 101]